MPGTDQHRQPSANERVIEERFVDGPRRAAGSANGHHPWPTLRRDIVVLLRQVGPSSPDQLAARLGASRTGILQQLRALETADLVMRRTERHGVGRPRHLYDVTAQAQGIFPSNYDGLAAGLLAAIESVGGGNLMDEIFAARRRQSVTRMKARLADRLPAQASLADRVRELAVIQDELGYLAQAEIRPDGTIRLVEHNCAILEVARGTARACEAELALFGEVLDADVVRESHIAGGDRCCTYRVVSRAD
jgi:predicted ArsR family transcriptional regulator